MEQDRNLEDLVGQARQLSEQARGMVADLSARTVEGHAADGRVTALSDVFGGLRSIDVHSLALRQLDNLTLGDAIVEAVQQAEGAAERMRKESLDQLRFGGRSILDLIAEGPDLTGLM
jgi:DNA-binding protein YbaB